MSNETQKKIAVALAWLGAMILFTLWAVAAYGQAIPDRCFEHSSPTLLTKWERESPEMDVCFASSDGGLTWAEIGRGGAAEVDTCAPQMASRECLQVNPSYGKVIYMDPITGMPKVIEPGSGAPPVAFIEPPTPRPTADQCGTKVSLNRWYAQCPTTALPNRSWVWVGPPPLTACTRHTSPRFQFGWHCTKGIDSVGGWHGEWIAERRPA